MARSTHRWKSGLLPWEMVVFLAGELERVLVAMLFDDPQLATRVFGLRLMQIRWKRKSALAAL